MFNEWSGVENQCVSLFVCFDLPESSHAHRSHRGPGFWGLSQTESAAGAAECRRSGGRRQPEKRQRFVCQRYRRRRRSSAAAAVQPSVCDRDVFVKLVCVSSTAGLPARSWVRLCALIFEYPGRKSSKKLLFQLPRVEQQHKSCKTRKRRMKWSWGKLCVNLPKPTVTLLGGSRTNGTLKTNRSPGLKLEIYINVQADTDDRCTRREVVQVENASSTRKN